MAHVPVPDLLALAKHLAVEAGCLISSTGAASVQVAHKGDGSLVTEADHAAQAHILGAIADVYPDHAVVAEEAFAPAGDRVDRRLARYCWVVDPLDGTRNYVAGLPCYSTAIAVLDHGRPVVGVVAEHVSGRLHAASEGTGATCDGNAIHPRRPSGEEDILIGVPSSKDDWSVHIVQRWSATRGLILRNLGSTAMHLALVATGALGAAFGKRAKIWDIASGWLLVTECGGRITDPHGEPLAPFDLTLDPQRDIPFLAGAADAHERLLKSLG